MRFSRCSWLGLLAIAVVSQGFAQNEAADHPQDWVAAHVQPLVDAEIIPGISVAIHHAGATHYFGFGATEIDGSELPDEHTFYEIGSVTKLFTGVLLADSVGRGEVKLNDPLSVHLPEGVRAPKRDGTEPTLIQLATHTSSLPRMPENFAPNNPEDPYVDYSDALLWEFLGSWRPPRAPGEEHEYSNLGMGLLGQILAKQGKSSYEKLVIDRVASPLGLGETKIQISSEERGRVALGSAEARTCSAWNFDCLAGCGALRSTAHDLMKFLVANMKPTKDALGKALEKAQEIHFRLADGQGHGLGWRVALDGSTYWHGGQTAGYTTYVAFNRRLDTAVVVLANAACGEVSPLGVNLLLRASGREVEPVVLKIPPRLTAEQLDLLIGEYKSSLGFTITVSRQKHRLYAQVTGQPAFHLVPETPTLVKYRSLEAEIEFTLADGANQAAQLTLFQHGSEFVCPRSENTKESL